MKLGLLFMAVAAACGYGAFQTDALPGKVLLLNCAAAFLILALAYCFSAPRLLMKRSDGKFAPPAYLLLWPYFALNQLTLGLFRLTSREPAMNEIIPGLHLGCRLWPRDKAATDALNLAGVLDLTCEFSETAFLRGLPGYRCVPLLDNTAPTVGQLKDGVAFLREKMQKGPVYVHCAMGHGRSATMVAAYLIASGAAVNVETAVGCMRKQRPRVRPKAKQIRVLREFAAGLSAT